MKRLFAAVIVIVAMLGVSHAEPTYRINQDRGGRLDQYAAKYHMLAAQNKKIEIRGYCVSACTLVLTDFPRHRVCVGPKAVLGFHQASTIAPNGEFVRSEIGTQWLYNHYGPSVRAWIDSRGGLTKKMLWLRGSELRKHFKPC